MLSIQNLTASVDVHGRNRVLVRHPRAHGRQRYEVECGVHLCFGRGGERVRGDGEARVVEQQRAKLEEGAPFVPTDAVSSVADAMPTASSGIPARVIVMKPRVPFAVPPLPSSPMYSAPTVLATAVGSVVAVRASTLSRLAAIARYVVKVD